MKLVTFTWSRTIEVPDSFNPDDKEEIMEAEMRACSELVDETGEITEILNLEEKK